MDCDEGLKCKLCGNDSGYFFKGYCPACLYTFKICYQALKRVWDEWRDSTNANDPEAEGYDTLRAVRAAVEAVERRKGDNDANQD
jgi:hypothetical protein